MKHADIVKLHTLGLITEDQRRQIIERLSLKEEEGRLMQILATLGAVLVVAGVILLISANWENIPRGVKIGTGLALMLVAWAGGWFLRERRGSHPKTGEALYLVGAGLWLANIALVGQIYHLSSRMPNAILLWLAGIAATPWILRARGLFAMSLIAGVVWIGCELNAADGLFGGSWNEAQVPLYGLVGLFFAGWGWFLRTGRRAEFADAADRLGMLLLLGSAYPFCWRGFWVHGLPQHPAALTLLPVLLVGGVALLALGLARTRSDLPVQWRWTWGLTLGGLGTLLTVALALGARGGDRWSYHDEAQWLYMAFALGLFVACLLQVQVGVMLRQPFLVNLALALVVLVLIAVYVSLFGTMATTGWMLLLSGIFLLAFGVYLERKRRQLLRQMRPAATANP